jgi:uncharacterized phage protein (TIGR02218 family)
MTYDAFERSEYSGTPVELYHFACGTQNWYLTDSDADFIFAGITYSAGWAIERSEPELSKETTRASLKITSAIDMPVPWLYRAGAPWDSVWVTVLRAHRGDTQSVLLWQGRVKGVIFHLSKGEAEINCDPIAVSVGKTGFRQNCGPQCNKQLYSTRCGMSEALFSNAAVITGIDPTGLIITSATFGTRANNFFKLGELYVNALGARMQIVAHTGNNITLRRPIIGLVLGMAVRGIAGCDHVWKLSGGVTYGDCITKFNNGINFLGFPFIPTKNPYTVGLEG